MEEEEAKMKLLASEKEKDRIAKIECPNCKSADKSMYELRGNNGIIGSGYSSWIKEAYLICKDCGIHYSDIKKKINYD